MIAGGRLVAWPYGSEDAVVVQGRAEDFSVTRLNGHPAFAAAERVESEMLLAVGGRISHLEAGIAANAPEFFSFLRESDDHVIWR